MIKAITVGVLPFLIGDTLKIAVAALIAVKIRDRVKIEGLRN